ncbi:MAG: HRDC domain-containing protein [Planctomycetota bacterium]|nr:HRDC domain-containing protein [Planctomycetota bacterium]
MESDEAAQALFEALRDFRREIARAEQVPAYRIAWDRTLQEVAQRRPRNQDELLQIWGIGPQTAERYGAGLLGVVARAPPSLRGKQERPASD